MSDAQLQTKESATAAFVLSLLAGVWMLSAGGMMGGFGGMMGGQYGVGHMHGIGSWMWGMHTFGVSWPWVGVIAGIFVLIGAVMLYIRPGQRRTWGLLILVASVLGVFLGIGAILGIIGGILALAAKA